MCTVDTTRMIPHETSESKRSGEKGVVLQQSEDDGAPMPEQDASMRICNRNSSSDELESGSSKQDTTLSMEQLIRQQQGDTLAASWRPARLSITIDIDALPLGKRTLSSWMSTVWGVVQDAQQEGESGRILVTKMSPSGEGGDNEDTVPECPLQEGEYVLEQVNGQTDFRELELHEILDQKSSEEGCASSLVTLILTAREDGDDDDEKSNKRIHPNLFQASLVKSPSMLQLEESQQKEDSLGIEFHEDTKHAGVNLCIKSIGKEGPWAASVLQTGDLLLTFNGADCHGVTVSDAHFFLQTKVALEGAVTVKVARPNNTFAQNWGSKAKRASVAVGGGALVTVGGVLMATPLHPVGHGLAIGGVALLGTEFEAPRNAVQSARTRFRRALLRRQWSSAEE